MFYIGNQNFIDSIAGNGFDEFAGNSDAIRNAQAGESAASAANKKKKTKTKVNKNPIGNAAAQATVLSKKKKVVIGAGVGANVGGGNSNVTVGATADMSVTREVPAKSTCKYVATFIGSGGTVAMINIIGLGYQVYKRGSLKNSEQAVKKKFETQFDNVSTTSSSGGGAIECNFVTRANNNYSKADLRNICDKLMKSATGYGVQTSFLEVTKIGNTSTGNTIKNSPTQKNQAINDFQQNVADTAVSSLGAGATGFLSNLGISLPIAVLIGGIVLVVVMKK